MTGRMFLLAGAAGAAVLIAVCAALPLPADAGGPAATDSARIELGRRLFFDPEIGRAGRVSCAACHDPEHGFSDPRVQSVDETGALPRHSQPLTDLGGRGFHWDGEFDTVREIVEARVLPRSVVAVHAIARSVSRAEAADTTEYDWDPERLRARADAGQNSTYSGGDPTVTAKAAQHETSVERRLAASGFYSRGFASAYGSANPALDRVVDAVDAYVRSLRTTENALDRFLAGDKRALTPPAQRGLALFTGKAACAQCHATKLESGRAILTDRDFHDTGLGWDREKDAYADRGLGEASLRPHDDGRFKTPSLRDVARRPPYMHDGRFATLEQVVRYYDGGGTPHAQLDGRIRKLGLGDAEVADLVAFLESLDGNERAGLANAPAGRPATLRVRVVDLARQPRSGVRVELRPAGDRLRGGATRRDPVVSTTAADGTAVFPWPATTHVSVACPDTTTVPIPLVPDWMSEIEVLTPETDPLHALLAVPAGLTESIDVIRAVPALAGSSRLPMTLTLVRRIPAGKALFVADRPLAEIGGTYLLTTADGRGTIGGYVPANWAARAEDVVPVVRPEPDQTLRIPADVLERLRRLSARGR